MNLNQICEKLKLEKSVAIFCHIRPDGDTIGSAVALKLGLEKLGIFSKVFCSDEIPTRFFFLPQLKCIENTLSEEFSAYLSIDCADITRLGYFALEFEKTKNTYIIDHHVSNNGYAKFNYICERSSNCENVMDVLECLGVKLTKEIASCLALGIVTDTGNFKHKNVNYETLLYASKAVKAGADVNEIVFNTFTRQSKQRAKLFGKVMSKIRYFLDDRVAVASVFLSDLQESGAKSDETEGFIDFVMGIDCVEVGVCIMQTAERKFKISLRSKKADVNEVALRFGGGGHILASGCQINSEYEDVVDRIVFAISRVLED